MTAEQMALLRKARASLAAAATLREQRFFDFAASRAYYTMFYIAEAMLLQNGLSFSKHSAVIAAFGQQFAKSNPALEEFHRYLIDGQDSRNIADYDIGPGISEGEATTQIERAEKFVELAQSTLGSLPEDATESH